MNGVTPLGFGTAAVIVHSRFIPSHRSTEHVVALLPAFPFSTGMWEPMVAEFHKLRHDTAFILVDFPGFGKSTSRQNWDFSSFALELRGVLEQHTRRPVILGGLSMGGYATLEFFRLHPDLLRGLILSNTRAEADSEKERNERAVFAVDVLAHGPEVVMKRNYPNFITEKTPKKIADQIRDWIFDAKPEAVSSALMTMAKRRDSSVILDRIQIPTLVIASEHDRITRSTTMRKMTGSISTAMFCEIEGAAHLSAAEKPEVWAKLLAQFLEAF